MAAQVAAAVVAFGVERGLHASCWSMMFSSNHPTKPSAHPRLSIDLCKLQRADVEREPRAYYRFTLGENSNLICFSETGAAFLRSGGGVLSSECFGRRDRQSNLYVIIDPGGLSLACQY